MTRRTDGIFRPNLTSHAEMIHALWIKINDTALYDLSETDICKIAIEKMFKRAFPDKQIVSKRKKMYIPYNQ
jgi:hypothetical protein